MSAGSEGARRVHEYLPELRVSRRRIVPAATWRRLLAGLSPTAVAAGEATGDTLDDYRRDRDRPNYALEGVLAKLTWELSEALLNPVTWAGNIREVRRGITTRDAWPSPVGRRGEADVADHLRATALAARTLAGLLRDRAASADTIALGLDLLAEDHDAYQRVVDLLAAYGYESESGQVEAREPMAEDRKNSP